MKGLEGRIASRIASFSLPIILKLTGFGLTVLGLTITLIISNHSAVPPERPPPGVRLSAELTEAIGRFADGRHARLARTWLLESQQAEDMAAGPSRRGCGTRHGRAPCRGYDRRPWLARHGAGPARGTAGTSTWSSVGPSREITAGRCR